jgi:hypothetical protein
MSQRCYEMFEPKNRLRISSSMTSPRLRSISNISHSDGICFALNLIIWNLMNYFEFCDWFVISKVQPAGNWSITLSAIFRKTLFSALLQIVVFLLFHFIHEKLMIQTFPRIILAVNILFRVFSINTNFCRKTFLPFLLFWTKIH